MGQPPQEKANKASMKNSVLRTCAVFILILSIVLSTLGAFNYRNGMMTRYESYIQGILKYALTEVDADALAADIESGVPSKEYISLQDVLDRMKEEYEIHYIYIVKPLSTDSVDNMMNVMAGANTYEKENEADSLAHLGDLTGDAYSPEVAGYYLDAMKTDKGTISYFANTTEYGSDYTGMTPIVDSKGNAIAILGVDISIDEINSVLMRFITISAISAVLLAIIFIYSMVKWFDKRIVSPINAIKHTAESFVESSHGKTDPEEIEYIEPQLEQRDEIWDLSQSLGTMASDLKTYMGNLLAEMQEKERISTELNVATEIQADMLPSIFPAFPEHEEIDIFASMDPAKEVGGDFYDLFEIDKQHIAMVIADVSGKGVPAALFMVIAKTLIKNRAQMGGTPAEILNDVNVRLCEGNGAGMFVTVWLAILDITTGKGMVANAGHEHPVLCRAGGEWELVKYQHSPVVGLMDFLQYKEHEFQLYPGDRLFVYTDGVPEAADSDRKMYGEERMLAALNGTDKDASLETLLHNVRASVADFVGDAEQFDDLTMLSACFKGVNSAE